MAHQPNSSDRDDPYRPQITDDDVRRGSQSRSAGGPVNGWRIAVVAFAVAAILGAVLYGLDSPPVQQVGTSSIARNAAQDTSPTAPPGMRDVTPRRANSEPGVTTGTAPMSPKPPPASASGSTP